MTVPDPRLQRLAKKIVSGLAFTVRNPGLRRQIAEMALRAYREERDAAAGEAIFREDAPPEIAEVLAQIEAEPVFAEGGE